MGKTSRIPLLRGSAILLLSLLLSGTLDLARSQGAVDGFLKRKGKLGLAFSSSQEFADTYLAGPDTEVGINNNRNATTLFGNYGLSDHINLILNLPLVNFQPQDGAFYVKAGTNNLSTGDLQLTPLVAAGASAPMSDYETHAANAIGQQATTFRFRGSLQSIWRNHVFLQLRGGYDHSLEPVPNGYLYSIKGGYFQGPFYSEVWLEQRTAIDGKDYRGSGDLKPDSFRELGLSQIRVGGGIHYRFMEKWGVAAKYWQVLDGRNTFLSKWVSLGVTFSL